MKSVFYDDVFSITTIFVIKNKLHRNDQMTSSEMSIEKKTCCMLQQLRVQQHLDQRQSISTLLKRFSNFRIHYRIRELNYNEYGNIPKFVITIRILACLLYDLISAALYQPVSHDKHRKRLQVAFNLIQSRPRKLPRCISESQASVARARLFASYPTIGTCIT